MLAVATRDGAAVCGSSAAFVRGMLYERAEGGHARNLAPCALHFVAFDSPSAPAPVTTLDTVTVKGSGRSMLGVHPDHADSGCLLPVHPLMPPNNSLSALV